MDTKVASLAGTDDCIAAQALALQPIRQRLRAVVREEAPQARETISCRMPAFMQGGALLCFAAFRKHIGLHPPVRGDAALLQALAPCRGENGNLSFALTRAMPYELIRHVVRPRVQENASKPRGCRTM